MRQTFAERARRAALKLRVTETPRVLVLISVALTVLSLALLSDYLLTGSSVTFRFLWPPAGGEPEWKDLFQALLLLMGLPIGLTLWYWRDLSVRHQIENARKDTTLKEFGDLQLRAAGAMDETYPIEARITLQVAALHQLRPYLRGDAGRSFQLAAFEIYCSILQGRRFEEALEAANESKNSQEDVLIDARIFSAVRDIVHDEWKKFFCSGLPLNNRSLRNLKLPRGSVLKDLNINGTDFTGSNLSDITFSDCSFVNCNFNDSFIGQVKFYNMSFLACFFSNCSIRMCDIFSSKISFCEFDNARVIATLLRNNRIGHVNFTNSDLTGCFVNFCRLSKIAVSYSYIRKSDI